MSPAGNYYLNWNPSTVLISFIISYLGSSIALILSEQLRLTSKENSPLLYNKTILILAQSAAQGAVGVVAMQIIGNNAISLTDSDGNILKNRYRLDFLLVSLVVVILCAKIGLFVCVRDEVYAMNKVETLEIYIRDCNNMTIGEMKQNKSRNSVVFRTLFKGISSLLTGGVFYAIALLVGSYLSVLSLVIDECTIEWNAGPLVAVIILSINASCLCCWIVFRLLALYPYYESLRFACSILIGISICGVHYLFVGAAVTFVHVPGETFTPPYSSFIILKENDIYLGIIVGALLYSCVVLHITLADTRSWFYRSSKSSRTIDEKIMNIAAELDNPEFNGNSSENAVLFMNEFKKFVADYKIFKGDQESSDTEKQIVSTKPVAKKLSFDVIGEQKSGTKSATLKTAKDSSKLDRQGPKSLSEDSFV
jgi:NO-binding membrane sensor protein with MHYT domain